MAKVNDILLKSVSFQPNAWSQPVGELSVGDILYMIKKGKYQDEIEKLRGYLAKGDIKKYALHKKRLPCVTFCGTYEPKRNREYLKQYNELLVIDIDDIDINRLSEIKQLLLNDKYVFSFWESPSKQGIKGLIKLFYSYPFERREIDSIHKDAFSRVYQHFFDQFNIKLDKSGCDITRLCFISFDKELIIKSDTTEFIIEKGKIDADGDDKIIIAEEDKSSISLRKASKAKLYDPTGRNLPSNRTMIQSIIKYLRKRNKSITSNYENWCRVALAIADSFTFDIGEKYYLNLCRLDGPRHDEIESKNMIMYCYENTRGEINFKTIVYIAQKHGYGKGGTEGG